MGPCGIFAACSVYRTFTCPNFEPVVGRNTVCAHQRPMVSAVMHTSRVSSPRYSASRVFFCLETASLYSSPTRLTRLLPQLIFHCATVFYATRRHSPLLASGPHSPMTLDSPRARLAASCASLGERIVRLRTSLQRANFDFNWPGWFSKYRRHGPKTI
jgi:hypothetical protein